MNPVLLVDEDRCGTERLIAQFASSGVPVEIVEDGFAAIEKLRQRDYCAVVLDPMIRQRLNGYVVLNFIEAERPDIIRKVFLFTGMSEQTIERTAPSILPRLFRKPGDPERLAAAVLRSCGISAAANRKRSLLLIEDDRGTAVVMSRLAEELGFDVTPARTGREAMDLLASREFDAVLLDLVLPDVDGFTVLDHLRAHRAGLLERVIVVTGMPERYVKAIDVDRVCAFIHKPVDSRMLARALQRCGRDVAFEAGGESPAF